MSYLDKDKLKFSICTHLQSHGCKGSSSWKYRMYNTFNLDLTVTSITKDSIVGISTNGNRPNRKPFPEAVLEYLHYMKCTIVTDNKYDTERSYNIGEREVRDWLLANDYVPTYSNERTVWNIN